MANITIIGSEVTTPSITQYYYAIPNGIWNPTNDSTLNAQLGEMWAYWTQITISPYDDPLGQLGSYTIPWSVFPNTLLPDANDFVDDSLDPVYVTPLRMTEGGGTRFERHLVRMAALYIVWRVETRAYPGGGMPNDSPYGKSIYTQLNNEISECLMDQHRLKGQSLKARSRFVNPRIQPYAPYAAPGTTPPAVPGDTT